MVNYLFVVWYVLIHYNAETFGVVVVVVVDPQVHV